MIKQNNDTLDQMLKERERDKEGDEEREATETERWPVSTQTHAESESALHGEERTEQLNNRKRLRERQCIQYRVSAKTISCVTGNDTAGRAKREKCRCLFCVVT